MRRGLTIARIAAVYLLLGFVTTWAVAWGLALLPPGNSISQDSRSSDPDEYGRRLVTIVSINRGMGSARSSYSQYTQWRNNRSDPPEHYLDPQDDIATPWSHVAWCLNLGGFDSWGQRRVAAESKPLSDWYYGMDDARGFPVLSHWCAWNLDPYLETPSSLEQRLFGGIHVTPLASLNGGSVRRALPYLPIWSGLTLNTAFYALLFFILVRLTKSTRHLLRFRRGKCPKCGYDMTATFTTPCPECGHTACSRKIEMG